MTNEERANEIARCDCPTHYAGFSICNTDKFQGKNYCAVKVAALKAMQWKDEQLKTYLKEKWESFNADAGSSLNALIKCSVIEKIYRELFNEELTTNPYDTAKQNND